MNKEHFSVKSLLATNKKLEKTDLSGEFLSAGVSLAPSTFSGLVNTCKGATKACRDACIGIESGMNQGEVARQAKINRTLFFAFDPEAFYAQLQLEIDALVRKALRLDALPVVRLNVYSDERHEDHCPSLFEDNPTVQFMDYTKLYDRFGNTPENYHLTFSRSEAPWSEDQARKVLAVGGSVAVVFDSPAARGDVPGGPLPEFYLDHEVINGDLSDARFEDPAPCIVGLHLKGNNAAKQAARDLGFAVAV